MASSWTTSPFGLVIVGGYRRRQGRGVQRKGRKQGAGRSRRVHMLGNRAKGKDWSCLAWFSLWKWEKLSKTESVSPLAVESEEVIS